jgi:hypothetical protein
VDRWYISTEAAGSETYRARFLVEARTGEQGVSAVASSDTRGFASPDWTGFRGQSAPQAYLGLPGLWSGDPYDFVKGTADTGPGLPHAQVGCVPEG